jgi:hypothetical protein
MIGKKQKFETVNENRKKRHKNAPMDFNNVIDSLKNTNGRVRSIEENALIIQALAYFQNNEMSLDQACKECEKMFKGSHNTYRALWKYFEETGSLNISETHEKKGLIPHKFLEIYDMTNEEIESFIEFAYEFTISNRTGFSINDLENFLREEKSIIIDRSTILYLLEEYNFVWSNQPVYYGCQYQQDRISELKRFLFQYSQAKQLELQNTHVIVATDESWANTGTSFESSWVHKCDTENINIDNCPVCSKFVDLANGDAKRQISKLSIGKRCVFAHCITRNGLLVDEAKDGTFLQPPFDDIENLNKTLNTCEYIIECGNDNTKDYHQQMDFEKYVLWFENRLIKTLNSSFHDKKGVIFLDQCPFHMVSNGMPASNSSKQEIADLYKKHNIHHVQIKRFDEFGEIGPLITFETAQFNKNPHTLNPNLGGPSKDEMYIYLFLYLKKKKPDVLEPVISQIAKKHGHVVLFACPYNPNDMPSEFLNSYVKSMVKRRSKKNRSILELKSDIRCGFYGGETKSKRQHSPVNAKMCSGWFNKVEQNMNNEIRNILNIEANISNLWETNCAYSLFSPFFRIPKTYKTLQKLSKKFVIVIDNEDQQFFDL